MKTAATLLLLLCFFFPAQTTSDLSIQAQLVFKTGPNAIPPNQTTVEVLRNRTFRLLDAEPASLLNSAGVKLSRFESYGENHLYALVSEFLDAAEDPDSRLPGGRYLREYYAKAEPVLRSHIIKTIQTNADGKAVFKNVPNGTYYIVGAAGGQHAAIWNLRVDLSSTQVIVLDQVNQLHGDVK